MTMAKGRPRRQEGGGAAAGAYRVPQGAGGGTLVPLRTGPLPSSMPRSCARDCDCAPQCRSREPQCFTAAGERGTHRTYIQRYRHAPPDHLTNIYLTSITRRRPPTTPITLPRFYNSLGTGCYSKMAVDVSVTVSAVTTSCVSRSRRLDAMPRRVKQSLCNISSTYSLQHYRTALDLDKTTDIPKCINLKLSFVKHKDIISWNNVKLRTLFLYNLGLQS